MHFTGLREKHRLFRAVMGSADGASHPCCLFFRSGAVPALITLTACNWYEKHSSFASGQMVPKSGLRGAQPVAGAM